MSTATLAPARPGAGTPRPYRFPAFQTRILANGLRLIVANVPAYPVVTMLAVVEAGATRDPRDVEGLAQFTTRALAEGTRDMDALQLATRLEMLGTTIDTGADWDSAIVQLTALATRVDDAMAVLAEVLRHPAFPERELERVVQISPNCGPNRVGSPTCSSPVCSTIRPRALRGWPVVMSAAWSASRARPCRPSMPSISGQTPRR